MGEGTVFSLSFNNTIGGGDPILLTGGYPIPGLDGGGAPWYQIPGLEGGTQFQVQTGGTPSQVQMGGIPSYSWGYPHLRSGWGGGTHPADRGYPHPRSVWMGVPPSRLDGVPPPPVRRQISIASTCYAAGGVPLVFTQEDFLVC